MRSHKAKRMEQGAQSEEIRGGGSLTLCAMLFANDLVASLGLRCDRRGFGAIKFVAKHLRGKNLT